MTMIPLILSSYPTSAGSWMNFLESDDDDIDIGGRWEMNSRKLNNDLPLAWETRDFDRSSMHDDDDAPSESVEGKAIVDCHYENTLHTIVMRWGKKWRASSSGRVEHSGSSRSRPTNCNSFYESSLICSELSCVFTFTILFLSGWRVSVPSFPPFFLLFDSLTILNILSMHKFVLSSRSSPQLSLNFADIFLFFLLLLFSLTSRFSSFSVRS